MIKLGDKVKDSITGFSGVAVSRCEYLYGCIRVLVQPTKLKDGQPGNSQWFDEPQLIGEKKKKGLTGGPTRSVPSRRDPA